jgi:hypothetical protein
MNFSFNLVNVFDTGVAYLKINHMQKNTIRLAKLSEIYLNLEMDKTFQ